LLRRGVSSEPGSDRPEEAVNDSRSELNRGLRLEEAEDIPAAGIACRLADGFGRAAGASRMAMT